MNAINHDELALAEARNASPSLEDALEAARTLQMVRQHVGGFGRLEISQSIKRGRGRVLEAKLYLGGSNHARYVKPELAEVVQPAVDVLTKALNNSYSLRLDTADRHRMVLSITV